MAGSQNKTPNRKSSVFVGNLPYDVSEETLWKFFSDVGGITNVRIIRDRVTRVGKGFAYVEFQVGGFSVLYLLVPKLTSFSSPPHI